MSQMDQSRAVHGFIILCKQLKASELFHSAIFHVISVKQLASQKAKLSKRRPLSLCFIVLDGKVL